MKATWWGASALATALLCVPVEAGARDRHREDWRGQFGGRRDTFGMGYERGFREGAKHGEKDARRNRGFDFRHDDDYWEADNGYRSSYGPRHLYAQGYRRGYEEGYSEAYRYHGRGHGRDRWGYDRYRNEDRYRNDRQRYDPRYDSRYGAAHRHAGREGWCYERHDRDDDVIYEIPRY